ncbi:MFS transporter [Erwinia sp.]|uniref:MFS transporter n=1 Tax=Erwinia citreus TaxID=558 RepID=UPI003C78E557
MKLSVKTKACFGLGAFGKDIFSVVVMSYIMIFYTDVFGLTASLAGLVLLITRLIDAVSNPFLGIMMDKTLTQWGRFRPYLLVVPIPFAIFTVLMFWHPDVSPMMKFLYALVTFNIAGLCFTCIDVAIWGLMPNLTRDKQERSQLIALSRAFSNVAGMLFAPLVIPLVIFFGRGDAHQGYLWLGVVVGALSIIFCWILFFNTREISTPAAVKPVAIKETLSTVAKNRPVICVVLAMTTFGMSVGLQNATGIYYLKYYLHLPDYVPLYILLSYAFKVLGAIVAPTLLRKYNNAKAAFVTFALMGICSTLLIFSPVHLPVVYFVLAACFSLGIGVLLVSITGMMAEASDMLEHHSGQRNDGMLFSLNALSMQTGFALSAALAGIVLQWSGYQPNVLNQGPDALLAINLVRCLAPAVFCFAVLLAFRLWPTMQAIRSQPSFIRPQSLPKNGASHD